MYFTKRHEQVPKRDDGPWIMLAVFVCIFLVLKISFCLISFENRFESYLFVIYPTVAEIWEASSDTGSDEPKEIDQFSGIWISPVLALKIGLV